MKTECAIILMAKQPQAGKTKTRLCPPLSFIEAAWLYEAMLKDTLVLAGAVEDAALAVAVSPTESLAYFQEISLPGTLLIPVAGETIGVCLDRSIAALLAMGYRKALALNTDGPSLPVEYLDQAIRLLDAHDLVLGPGEDGGYYLVGMKQQHAALFDGIPWSTAEVLSATRTIAEKLCLCTALTPYWYDVDTPADALRLLDEIDRLPDKRLAHTREFFHQHPPGSWKGA